jgi:hypothetical protein
MAAHQEIDALYRVAVRAALGTTQDTPQVCEIAQTLWRLTGPMARRPPGHTRCEVDYDPAHTRPAIRSWNGIWGEVD